MDVTYTDSNGVLHIDWLYFLDVVRLVGIFISMLSAFILCCALVGGNDVDALNFFFACLAFGFVLIVEGTLASFFKIGDK